MWMLNTEDGRKSAVMRRNWQNKRQRCIRKPTCPGKDYTVWLICVMNPYYKDDWVTIYHGDCREVLPELPHQSIDLILTDPPFLTLFVTSDKKAIGIRNEIGNYTILEGWWNDIVRLTNPLLKDAGNYVTFCDWRTYPSFWRVSLQNHIMPRNCVVWIHNAARKWHMFRYCHQLALVAQKAPTKPTECPSGKLFDYWVENNVPTLEREHPVEKPEGFVSYLMQPATNEGGIVLDPFLGSGTTCFCAKKLNRQSIGIETEERYCEAAARRCSQEAMDFSETKIPQMGYSVHNER